ncbi:ABC transporter ATP-binding protein [Limnohabitans sp. 2KL-1]|jgi:branched-chain amino acid transport system ATP-binding protein|uniref:ABC transporter ATP-binding protein n=1 Tax=Limnohabitans sp. 2KL-1 TaxID=1100699 RepID=UPI000D357698|nr:ABC transporter ATP-binding protein [Limnohabitans sp. 2KL-1]PUE48038.1 ABC transporter ATP-binding protein [Limnohabitans sp. 2KL-1]
MSALLEVRNLETWYGPIAAMQGVNLQVEKGQMVAVLGANGAGKTTLLNTLAGVIDPFKGQVLLNAQAIQGLDADEVCRRGLVLVPEGRQIYPFLSVRENLNMGAYTRRDADGVQQDLERVFQWFPRLLERAQQHAGLLSGGEQQMLAIGRAYMAQPQLLMLDEPSLGLSPLLTKDIFNIISRIRDETGTSVLVVEQNAAIALAHADYGYIMELGRIVAADSCAVLSQKADVREAYLGGHGAQGVSGTTQRWKRRKTWR